MTTNPFKKRRAIRTENCLTTRLIRKKIYQEIRFPSTLKETHRALFDEFVRELLSRVEPARESSPVKHHRCLSRRCFRRPRARRVFSNLSERDCLAHPQQSPCQARYSRLRDPPRAAHRAYPSRQCRSTRNRL